MNTLQFNFINWRHRSNTLYIITLSIFISLIHNARTLNESVAGSGLCGGCLRSISYMRAQTVREPQTCLNRFSFFLSFSQIEGSRGVSAASLADALDC